MKSCYEQLIKEPIKKYKKFTLYQIYGILNGEKIPLYKVCK